ncbi:MAG: TonB-dependent receptor domain-containing protein [Sphingorhabdus sp.]
MSVIASVIVAAALLPQPASAQRTEENATTNAEDAFGSNVGSESLGVYDPNEVRGFSPLEAGNVRVEGLYFDRQGDFTGRLVSGNRIRVGPSALGYVLPAPSGIADYRLRKPAAELGFSMVGNVDSFGAAFAEADVSLPISGDTLRLGAGAGYYGNRSADQRTARVLSLAAIGLWQPGPQTEIIPFWSRIRTRDSMVAPIIRGNGLAVPDQYHRGEQMGQKWAGQERLRLVSGIIATHNAGAFDFSGGLFRSTDESFKGFTLLQDAAPLGQLSRRTVIADQARFSGSTSGELRITRHFETGRLRHAASLVVRGRQQDRRYGGADRQLLADGPYGESALVSEPAFAFGAQDSDQVRQYTLGLVYRAALPDVGEVNLGLQRIDYRKRVDRVGRPTIVTTNRPLLLNAAISFNLASDIALYAGFAEGLEESDIAPETAINRNEAPPAILTRQYDAGVRWRISDRANAVIGLFSIEKPYDGIDATGLYRRLGQVRHRGIEASFTGTVVDGLTFVAGAVVLDPQLSGEDLATGQVGARPVGVPRFRAQLSLDWRPSPNAPLSFDAVLTSRGSYFGDTANAVRVDRLTMLDLGLRYRFRIGRNPALFRIQGFNIFNAYGWDVVGSNGFRPNAPRQIVAKLTLDL